MPSIELSDCIEVTVSEMGVQGPPGVDGVGSSINLSGYGTTGSFDNRYLKSGDRQVVYSTGKQTIAGKIFDVNQNEFVVSGDAVAIRVTSDPFIYLKYNNNINFLDTEIKTISTYDGTPCIDLGGINSTPQLIGANWLTDTTGLYYNSLMNFGRVSGISGELNTKIINSGQSNYNRIVSLSGKLDATGSNLQNLINGLSGQLDISGSKLSSVRVTGSSNIQIADFTGVGNIILSYSGNKVFVSGNTGDYSSYYSNQNIAQFIRSGDVSSTYATITNLGTTGQNLYNFEFNNATNLSGNLTFTGQTLNNRINGLSGELQNSGTNLNNLISTERNKPTITGISISGGQSITGLFSIIPGANITFNQIGSTGFSIAASAGAAGNATNGVTGISITGGQSISGTISISAGANITLLQIGTTGFSIAGPAGGGEANTASNLGGGIGVFNSKSSVDLRFNSISGGTGINVTLSGGNTIFIDSNLNTGQFYATSNPAQFTTSGNLTSTGQTLFNLIGGLTGELQNTGTNLRNLINGLSGQLNISGGSLSAVKVTGSNILNVVNLTGAGNVVVSYSGQVVYFSGNTGDYSSYYSNQNPAQFIRSGDVSTTYATITNLTLTGQTLLGNDINISGNLASTGSNLNNKIIGLSGIFDTTGSNLFNLITTERNKETITGLSISGGNSMTGKISIIQGANITLVQLGNTGFSIAGNAGGGTVPANLTTGSGISQYVVKFAPDGSGLINSNIIDSGSAVGLIAPIAFNTITGKFGINVLPDATADVSIAENGLLFNKGGNNFGPVLQYNAAQNGLLQITRKDIQTLGRNYILIGYDGSNAIVGMTSQGLVGWSNSTITATPQDTAIMRTSAGTLEINNATSSQYRDLITRNSNITGYAFVNSGVISNIIKQNINGLNIPVPSLMFAYQNFR